MFITKRDLSGLGQVSPSAVPAGLANITGLLAAVQAPIALAAGDPTQLPGAISQATTNWGQVSTLASGLASDPSVTTGTPLWTALQALSSDAATSTPVTLSDLQSQQAALMLDLQNAVTASQGGSVSSIPGAAMVAGYVNQFNALPTMEKAAVGVGVVGVGIGLWYGAKHMGWI
jgi:hypothetical protein